MCAETEPKTFRPPCLPQPYNLPIDNKLRSLNPLLSLHSRLEKIKEKKALLFSIMDQSYPSSRACCPVPTSWTKVYPKSLFVKISQFLLWGGGHLTSKASFISARRLGSFPEEKGGSSLHSRVKIIISQRREEREEDKRKESQVRIIILIVVACQMGALKVVLLYLIVHQAWKITADDEEWKSATATYVKDTNGSIVVEGACGYGDLHKATYGKYSAGLSSMLFNRGSACGACFEVRCVDHILWCLQGSPPVILTATDFCPPNYGLSADYGGWCNFPKEHFEMSEAAFSEIAEKKADIVPVQHRRVKCGRRGGVRFTVSGNFHFYQVLISNVGLDGEVIAVKVKGSKTAWIPMARNWGQNWQSNANLIGQPLSFEVTTSSRKTLTSYNVAPANWQFGQTFEGKQF